MSKDQVKFSNGMLTLTAKKVTGQPDAVHGGKNIKINYLAGAIHAKEHFTSPVAVGTTFRASSRRQRQRYLAGFLAYGRQRMASGDRYGRMEGFWKDREHYPDVTLFFI